jgi:tellurite resistance protein TerC
MLSLDNMFVFVMIFKVAGTPRGYQPMLLYCGLALSIIARIALIEAGTLLVQALSWFFPLMGCLLVFAAVKIAMELYNGDSAESSSSGASSGASSDGESTSKVAPNNTSPLLPRPVCTSPSSPCTAAHVSAYALRHLTVVGAVAASDAVCAMDSIPVALSISTDAFVLMYVLLGTP